MANNAKMSVTQLTLLTALNMMGSGIIMLPTKLAQVGTFSIVSWLVTATGSTALAYAFAKCGMLSRNKAGMGGYAEYAFGKSGSFMANYTYCVSLLIANIAIAISAVGYGIALLGIQLSPVETCVATIGVLWICTVLNFKGASITGAKLVAKKSTISAKLDLILSHSRGNLSWHSIQLDTLHNITAYRSAPFVVGKPKESFPSPSVP